MQSIPKCAHVILTDPLTDLRKTIYKTEKLTFKQTKTSWSLANLANRIKKNTLLAYFLQHYFTY